MRKYERFRAIRPASLKNRSKKPEGPSKKQAVLTKALVESKRTFNYRVRSPILGK